MISSCLLLSSFLTSSLLAFGIPSGPDLIILLIIVLVLFGAKRLPEIARSLGESVHEFKKAKQEFEDQASKPTSNSTSALTSTNTPPSTSTTQEELKKTE